MSFNIIYGDIVDMKVDAIVNPANKELLEGGGACGAIFRRANDNRLKEECAKLAPIKTSEAVITKGYNLFAKYIIHAVGPIWRGGNNSEEEYLYNAYTSALNVAVENGIKSLAFPLISAGIYGFDKDLALKIAKKAINDFLNNNELDITLVLFKEGEI